MEIGGRAYTFRLTTSAMAELEDACGTPTQPMYFPQILDRVMQGSAKFIRLFVWACLLDKHPDTTVIQAGALIDEAGGLITFAGRLKALLNAGQPDKEDLRPLKAQATRGAGGRSTSKRAKSA